jgi:hypothetical protein
MYCAEYDSLPSVPILTPNFLTQMFVASRTLTLNVETVLWKASAMVTVMT